MSRADSPMLARRSSMCSAPTHRSDSGGSPPSVTGVTSAFTTGPRTVERIVTRARRLAAHRDATRTLIEIAATRRRRDSGDGSSGSTSSRYRSRVEAMLLVIAHAMRAVAAPPHAREARMAGAGGIVLRPVQRDIRTSEDGTQNGWCGSPHRIGMARSGRVPAGAPSCCCPSHRRCPPPPRAIETVARHHARFSAASGVR